MGAQRRTTQTRSSAVGFNFGAIFGKKARKRDIKGRKMTQKGAIHAKNPPRQPNRSAKSNRERHVERQIGRSALYRAIKGGNK